MTRERGWMVRRLPVGMQEDRVLVALVSILEEVAESVQQHADQTAFLADPAVTPEVLLSWLGRFIDAPDTENLPPDQRRDLLRDAGSLILRKGTNAHVRTLVAPYVSGTLEVDDDGGIYRIGQAPTTEGRVRVRAGSITHGTPSDLLKLVRSITPSHCVVSLEVGGVPLPAEER